ncbi:hypothetical protein BDV25DRAFT_137305 [Aspergillus avenaceus]|uniref:Uncharacterized protein n=1 Tax=Aspergillus avenaceus TaxID=36643 RepID=A0A5N6U351_ASPAV|nr:hypothetical protein BDV25DRAFT_137305 [Aspergillus avenaceus]
MFHLNGQTTWCPHFARIIVGVDPCLAGHATKVVSPPNSTIHTSHLLFEPNGPDRSLPTMHINTLASLITAVFAVGAAAKSSASCAAGLESVQSHTNDVHSLLWHVDNFNGGVNDAYTIANRMYSIHKGIKTSRDTFGTMQYLTREEEDASKPVLMDFVHGQVEAVRRSRSKAGIFRTVPQGPALARYLSDAAKQETRAWVGVLRTRVTDEYYEDFKSVLAELEMEHDAFVEEVSGGV